CRVAILLVRWRFDVKARKSARCLKVADDDGLHVDDLPGEWAERHRPLNRTDRRRCGTAVVVQWEDDRDRNAKERRAALIIGDGTWQCRGTEGSFSRDRKRIVEGCVGTVVQQDLVARSPDRTQIAIHCVPL